MADIKAKFGTGNQSATITLASLGNGSARQSTEIDNSTNLFLDALLTVKVKTGASGVSGTGHIAVYAYGTTDGGTTRTDGAGASDAAITRVNARLIGTITASANATTYIATLSVAAAFGGVLPEKWGIIVENNTGAALDSTGGNHAVTYQGVLAQTV